jgi:hypothetical protein
MSTGAGLLPILLSQLIYQLPTFLVCLVGVVLAVGRRRELGRAAMFMIGGACVLLVTGIGFTVVQSVLIANQPPSSFGQVMAILGIASSVLRAAGLGLIVAAVFVGRAPFAERAFPVETHVPA